MHNPLFVHTSALTWICVPSLCRSPTKKKELLQQYFQCVIERNEKTRQNEKKKRRRQIQKEKKSKVCGASSNSNTICINVFHNRHDFLFHRLTIVSNHKYYYNKKKQEKKQAKYLNTVTITNKLSSPSSLCAKPRSHQAACSQQVVAALPVWEELLVNYVKVAWYDYYRHLAAIYAISILFSL